MLPFCNNSWGRLILWNANCMTDRPLCCWQYRALRGVSAFRNTPQMREGSLRQFRPFRRPHASSVNWYPSTGSSRFLMAYMRGFAVRRSQNRQQNFNNINARYSNYTLGVIVVSVAVVRSLVATLPPPAGNRYYGRACCPRYSTR